MINMKSFNLYLVEKQFVKLNSLKMKDIYCLNESDQVNEIISLAAIGAYKTAKAGLSAAYNVTKFGMSVLKKIIGIKPQKIEEEIKDKDKKIVIKEFLKSAVKKLGIVVVVGALLYLGLQHGVITDLLSWTGQMAYKALMYILGLGGNTIWKILMEAWNAIKDFAGAIGDYIGAIVSKTGELAEDQMEKVGQYMKDLFKKTGGTFGNPDGGNPWENPQEKDWQGNQRTVLTPKESPKPIDWDGLKDTFGSDKKKLDPNILNFKSN